MIKLTRLLEEKGGCIVGSSQLNIHQVAQADAEERSFVTHWGIKFVWLPPETVKWLIENNKIKF